MHKYTFMRPRNFDEWLERFCFYTWYGKLITAVLVLGSWWLFAVLLYAVFG